MRINEVFHSIQGEGLHTNVPMNFIRLQGCNLYPNCCSYCDTGKSQKPNNGGFELSVKGVLERIKEVQKGPCNWYCITGGEPLLQGKEVETLVLALEFPAKVEIETNGTLPPPAWHLMVDSWVVDIKCPSAGVGLLGRSQFKPWNLALRSYDQVKFVVGETRDLDFVRGMLETYSFTSHVLISPVVDSFGSIQHTIRPGFMSEVVDFVLKYNLRLSVQVHKFVGVR